MMAAAASAAAEAISAAMPAAQAVALRRVAARMARQGALPEGPCACVRMASVLVSAIGPRVIAARDRAATAVRVRRVIGAQGRRATEARGLAVPAPTVAARRDARVRWRRWIRMN